MNTYGAQEGIFLSIHYIIIRWRTDSFCVGHSDMSHVLQVYTAARTLNWRLCERFHFPPLKLDSVHPFFCYLPLHSFKVKWKGFKYFFLVAASFFPMWINVKWLRFTIKWLNFPLIWFFLIVLITLMWGNYKHVPSPFLPFKFFYIYLFCSWIPSFVPANPFSAVC